MKMRMIAAATCLAVFAASCAAVSSQLDQAKTSCDRAVDQLTRVDGCDAYVAAALQSGDKNEIFNAYTYRALLREFREDLPGALADADQAIAALPFEPFGHRRRATLLGESGEYKQALELFAAQNAVFPSVDFDESIAMLEYVAGDRARAVQLFQSAAVDYAEGDHDETTAAIHRFTAAIIESELRGGDPAPIETQNVSAWPNTMLPLLKRHRLGELSDAELLDRVAGMTGGAARENKCDAQFSVGHRNALAGDGAAARKAFQDAVAGCNVVTFEYHAAKAWLRRLGGG